VANKPGHPGEREVTVKTIARGMPGDSGVTVVTNARATYHTTRGYGRIGARHSLLPSWGSIAPSDLSGHTVQGKTRAVARRDREAVAAREAV
jgi:hypothetical protein